MAKHTSRFARPSQGFLTLWALLFLAAMSLTLTIVLAGQYARIQTTTQLVRQYDQIAVDSATERTRARR
ncbi:hypothetical protein [Levilactobacillus zymae]|uniref:Uncharacterized protein n=1 Tax=Levilactobacillus zymae TaxID=267363 RepID=A0ABQ0WTR5_9LACO|nr:hypothetical protein [Levilactobacillus zymae]QFR60381.1 hypothetical protein LZ395_01980 [Levilactobacillus zymae]GEO71165.1 hypothetical protein LZY01_03330 [Levilactobacillus zymae]